MRDDVTAPPEALMLFAAGRGTRMAPLTDRLPKPLIEVAGTTLLDRALDLAEAGGARRVVVNTHHLGHQIAAHVAGRGIAMGSANATVRASADWVAPAAEDDGLWMALRHAGALGAG